jgi:hypothetical protein
VQSNSKGSILYTIAILLIVVWTIGYLGYDVGGIIHILLLIALIAILLKLTKAKTI